MKKLLVLFSLLLLTVLAINPSSKAAALLDIPDPIYWGDGANHTINGEINASVTLGLLNFTQLGTRATLIEGGQVTSLNAFRDSGIIITGGLVGRYDLFGEKSGGVVSTNADSRATMSGGYAGRLIARGNSRINLTGGVVESSLWATDPNSKVVVVGSNFVVDGVALPSGGDLSNFGTPGSDIYGDYVRGDLTCTLADGSPIDVFFQVYIIDPFSIHEPEISLVNGSVGNGVTALQRDDDSGIVDIRYAIGGSEGGRTVRIEVSDDGGSSWNIVATDTTGDIGENIDPGYLHIVWNSKTDLPDTSGDEYQVRVFVDEVELGTSANFTIDNTTDGATISGMVIAVDAQGESLGALEGVALSIGGKTTESDAEGLFELTGLLPGLDTLMAEKEGYKSASKDYTLEAEIITSVTVKMEIIVETILIEEVSAAQQKNDSGDVDIKYTLTDPTNERHTISIEVSDDGGSSWAVAVSDVAGDLGENIAPGRRHIVWGSLADLPDVYGEDYRVRVTAQDGGSGESGIFTIDNRKNDPVVTSISGQYFNPTRHTYFLSGVSLDQEITATIDWKGHTPGEVQWFIDDSKDASDPTATDVTGGDTVSHSFNMGEEFSANEKLFVQAITKDGLASKKVEAKFTTIDPPFIVPAERLSAVTGNSSLKYTTSVFSIGWPKFDAKLPQKANVVNPENTAGIRSIGEVSFFTLIEVSAKISDDGICEIKLKSDKIGKSKDAFKVAGIGFDTQIWVKLVLLYQGQWTPGGGLGYTVSAKKDFGPKYWIFTAGPVPVPIFLKGAIGAAVNAELGLTGFGGGDGILFTGQVKPSASPEIVLGAGISDAAAVEGYLKGTVGLTAEWKNKINPDIKDHFLELDGGVRAYFFAFKYENNLLHFQWPEDSSAVAFGIQASNTGNIVPMGRDYLNSDYAQWQNSPSLTTTTSTLSLLSTLSAQKPVFGGGDGEITLQSNVFGQSNPVLAVSGNSKCLVWLFDDPARNSLDRTLLVYSINNGFGLGWSAPLAIDNDGTADLLPDICVDASGNFVCVWANASQLIPNGTGLIGFADKLDIQMAMYDDFTNTWASETVTSSAGLDYNPKVDCDDSGDITVAWTHDDNSDMLGENQPVTNRMMVRTKTVASGWAVAETLATENGLIQYTDLHADATSTCLVYSLDMDGRLLTDSDSELFYTDNLGGSWAFPLQLTSDPEVANTNPQLAMLPAGGKMLLWAQDGQIVSTTDIMGMTGVTAAVEQEGSSGQRNFTTAVSPTENISVIWNDPSDAGSDIYTATFDPTVAVWSDVVQITDTRNLERSLTGAYSDGDTLELAYNKVHIIDGVGLDVFGQVDLCVYTYRLGADLAVTDESIVIDNPNATPGDTVTLQATVANVGNLFAQNIPVAFYNGEVPTVENQIGETQSIDLGLAAGESDVASVSWTIPVSHAPANIIVVVDPDLVIDDKDRQNNSATIKLFGANLTLSRAEINRNSLGEFHISVEAINDGFATTDQNISLTLVNEEDPNLVDSQTVAPLASGQSQMATWIVEPNQIAYGFVPLSLNLDPDNLLVETNETDNTRTVLLDNHTIDYEIASGLTLNQETTKTSDVPIRLINGASVGSDLMIYDDINVVMAGGVVSHDLGALGNASITITGGVIGKAIYAYNNGVIHLFGSEFFVNGIALSDGDLLSNIGTLGTDGTDEFYTGNITGTLDDGSYFDNDFYILNLGNHAGSAEIVVHVDVTNYNIEVAKLKIKAGKNRLVPNGDSFSISGVIPADALAAFALVETNDLANIYLELSSESAGESYGYSEWLDAGFVKYSSKSLKIAYKVKLIRGEPGRVKSLSVDLKKGKFKIAVKNVDLSGLANPMTFTLRIGNTLGISTLVDAPDGTLPSSDQYMQAFQNVGLKKGLPLTLLVGVQDFLRVDKLKFKDKNGNDSLKVSGKMSIKNLSVDLSSSAMAFRWGSYMARIPAESITLSKGKYVIKHQSVVSGKISATIDINKATFKVSISKATIGTQPESAEFEILSGQDVPGLVNVPNVIGQIQASATLAIESAGLSVGAIDQAFSTTLPAGEVISQSPVAGLMVDEGHFVNLVVSLGQDPSQIPVPNVTLQTQATATAAITAANLSVGTIDEAFSDSVPSGQVINQIPATGTLVDEGSSVDLIISLGASTEPQISSWLLSGTETVSGLSYQDKSPVQFEVHLGPNAALGLGENEFEINTFLNGETDLYLKGTYIRTTTTVTFNPSGSSINTLIQKVFSDVLDNEPEVEDISSTGSQHQYSGTISSNGAMEINGQLTINVMVTTLEGDTLTGTGKAVIKADGTPL